MGNGLGGSRRTAKVMKIDGQTMKLKTPVQAIEVTKDHPGHVLLDSERVKHYGIRARPLDPTQNLEPKRLYFLVELPKIPLDDHRLPRRARSGGIHMSAKERLESLMLSRRSISDLSIMKPASSFIMAPDHHEQDHQKAGAEEAAAGPVRVRMRLPRAEVERLVSESKNEAEAAEKIMDRYVGKSGGPSSSSEGAGSKGKEDIDRFQHRQHQQQVQGNRATPGRIRDGHHKKRVGFVPINEAEIIQLAVAS